MDLGMRARFNLKHLLTGSCSGLWNDRKRSLRLRNCKTAASFEVLDPALDWGDNLCLVIPSSRVCSACSMDVGCNLSGISYLSNADSLSQNSFRVQMTPKVQARLHQRHHLGQPSHPLASHSRSQGRVCVKTSIQKQLSTLNNRNCCLIESYHPRCNGFFLRRSGHSITWVGSINSKQRLKQTTLSS